MNLALVLDPVFGPWLTGLVLAALAAGLLFEALWRTPTPNCWWRLGLRLAMVLTVAAFLLRPTAVNAEEQQLTPVLTVVFDSSRSLDLPPADALGQPPRRAAGERFLRDTLAPLLLSLPGRHETWTLNDTLHRLDAAPEKLTAWPACDGGSALADGVEAVINGSAPDRAGARCDGVILLTDGAITRGRSWPDLLATLLPSPVAVHVVALGDPDAPVPQRFDLGRIVGPDRVKAGEEARYSVAVRAPERFGEAGTLRLHWQLDGVEIAVHELPAPQLGAARIDDLIVPLSEPGLQRLTVTVEAPATIPPVTPPESSQLIHVDAGKIRALLWSMQLSRQTRQIERQLGRDSVLSVNVANDFTRGQPTPVANALRSADVLIWEAPDLERLPPVTVQLVETRLREGMGLVLLGSPRLDLTRSPALLALLPSQAAAPWQRVETQPIAPAELRKGTFWRGRPPVLPMLTGRLQQFESAQNTGGFDAVLTTAEGRPILLAGHPAGNGAVAVLLTPDWPEATPDADNAPATAGPPDAAMPWTVGPLIRHAVHWAAGLDNRPEEPGLFLRLSDDRPLADQPLLGAVDLRNLDTGNLDAAHLQLFLRRFPATGSDTTGAAAGLADRPSAQAIAWQAINGQVRFRLNAPQPGSWLVEAHWRDGPVTLDDRVAVYVAGEELEALTPPNHRDLRQLADSTGGQFVRVDKATADDLRAIRDTLAARLTPQPAVQIGREPLTGGWLTAGLLAIFLLTEMALRTRRLW